MKYLTIFLNAKTYKTAAKLPISIFNIYNNSGKFYNLQQAAKIGKYILSTFDEMVLFLAEFWFSCEDNPKILAYFDRSCQKLGGLRIELQLHFAL